MKNNLFIISLIVLVATSCTHKEVSTCETISIDFAHTKSIDIRDTAIVRMLTLELNDDAFLTYIERIECFNDKIFIYDSHRILIFDMQGKHLRTINHRGQGPEEYTSVYSFFINKDGNICVFDSQKLLVYDENGNYLSSRKVKAEVGAIYPAGDSVYIGRSLYAGSQTITPSLCLLNGDLEVIAYSENRSLYTGVTAFDCIHVYKEQMLYWELLKDTIFSIRDREVVPRYAVDFQEHKFPADLAAGEFEHRLEYFSAGTNGLATMLRCVNEDASSVRFIFNLGESVRYVTYQKDKKEASLYRIVDSKGEFEAMAYMTHVDGQTVIPVINANNVEHNPSLLFINDAKLE